MAEFIGTDYALALSLLGSHRLACLMNAYPFRLRPSYTFLLLRGNFEPGWQDKVWSHVDLVFGIFPHDKLLADYAADEGCFLPERIATSNSRKPCPREEKRRTGPC